MSANVTYPTTDYIEEILEKYIPPFNDKKTGLFLLPAQTGSGKTHAIANTILKILREYPEKKVHYVIGSRANRNEMYKLLTEGLKDSKELQDEIILLKSNTDHLIDFFSKNKQYSFRCLEHLKSFKEFKKKIDICVKNRSNLSEQDLHAIIRESETKLKQDIRKEYATVVKNDKQRGELLKEVAMLYPAVNLSQRVVISTTRKFLQKSFDLPKSSSLLEKLDKDTLVIIDEFDEQKRAILDYFVEMSVGYNIENVNFIAKLHKHLTREKIKKYPNRELLDAYIKEIGEFFEKYNLDYTIYAKNSDSRRFFLKESSSRIINADKRHFSLRLDTKKAKQFIEEKKEMKNGNDNDFLEFYRESERFIGRFISLSKLVAAKYQEETREDETKGDISFDDALRTFLTDIFGYNDGSIEFIVNRVYDYKAKGYGKRRFLTSGLAEAYENSYSIMHIKNDTSHNENSIFSTHQLHITPESMLLKMTQEHFVVGVSATALNETKLHNFDIRYIEENSALDKPSDEELQKLEALYLEHKVKERDYKVSFVSLIEGHLSVAKSSSVNSLTAKLTDLTGDAGTAGIVESFNQSDEEHFVKKIIQFVEVFKYFCLNDTNAFLCLNTFDLKNKGEFRDLMYALIFKMIQKHYTNMPLKKKAYLNRFVKFNEDGTLKNEKEAYDLIRNGEQTFIFYTSAQDKEKNYVRQLQQFGTVFLVSSFKHMATGQNIQYRHKEEEFDFDGIFVGEVTNIAISLLGSSEEDEKRNEQAVLKALYDMNVLQQSGIITFREMLNFFDKFLAFKRAKIPHKDTTEYYNAVMHKIIQAIGRLHRTNAAGTLHLLFDEKNMDALANYDYTGKAMLPAVKTAVDEARRTIRENKKRNADILEVIADKAIQNRRTVNKLLKIFNERRSSPEQYRKAVEIYNEVRRQLLRNPTTDKIELTAPEYIDTKGFPLYYKTDDDFETIEISFKEKPGFVGVSKESARVDVLERMPELEDCFKEYGIDTLWDKPYIMNPVSFNNLYKGILGETIGRFVLERYCGIELFEIDAESDIRFEAFDFTDRTQKVLFDFKYFGTETARSTEITNGSPFIENIRQKLKLSNIEDSKVFVVNIMLDEANEGAFCGNIETIDNKIYVVPFLIRSQNRVGKLDIEMITKLREEYDACHNK